MKLSSILSLIAVTLVIAVFAQGAQGQSFSSGNSALSITTCSAGFSTLYVTGVPSGSTVSFSANGGPLSVTVQPANAIVSSIGTAQAQLSVSAPACFTGNLPVNAVATICAPNGGCQSLSQQIMINVGLCQQPGFACSTTSVAVSQQAYGNSPSYCNGSGCTYGSQYQQTGYYLPSSYQVAVARVGTNRCLQASCDFNQAYAGSPVQIQYSIQNVGTSGTFQVTLQSSAPQWLLVNPNVDVADLSSGQNSLATFQVNVAPNTPDGRYKFNVIVSHNNVQVASVPDWIEVVSQQSGTVQIMLPPGGLTLNTCQIGSGIQVPAQLVQAGTSSEDFLITASVNGQQAYSNTVHVVPTVGAQFAITLPSSAFSVGLNTVTVNANSAQLSGSGSFQVILQPCSSGQVSVRAQSTPNGGNNIAVIAMVTNNGNAPISNVTESIAGLPSSWSFNSGTVGVIYPGQSQNVTINVQAGDSSTVTSTLVVLSNGVQVASVPLSLSTSASSNGATGLFFALSDPESLALLLIFLLAVIPGILLSRASSARAKAGEAKPASMPTHPHTTAPHDDSPHAPIDSTKEYVAHMRKLRERFETTTA